MCIAPCCLFFQTFQLIENLSVLGILASEAASRSGSKLKVSSVIAAVNALLKFPARF